jgi:atypical dual specificity phosphatase
MAAEKLQNFSFILEDKLAGSAHPIFAASSESELAEVFREAGVGAVVSLDERGLNADALREGGVEHLHLPIPDFQSPSMEQIRDFVDFVDANAEAGRPVLAHCHAGMGRTGAMLACYLVAQGMDPREAITRVRTMRPGSIETYGQEDTIYAFFRTLDPPAEPQSDHNAELPTDQE